MVPKRGMTSMKEPHASSRLAWGSFSYPARIRTGATTAQDSRQIGEIEKGDDAQSDAVDDLTALLCSLTPEQRAELARLLTPPPNTS
jgi:hypothetical protein